MYLINGLKPYEGGETCRTKKDYIRRYFELNQPRTEFQDGSKQCSGGKSRSFYDLLSICRAKFKTTTKKELSDILVSVIKEKQMMNIL